MPKAILPYHSFLDHKAQSGSKDGFKPLWLPEFLFDFQKYLVEWAILAGRDAIFADCGLGKTPMQLVWAENVVRETNRPVLILTPLAVSPQTVREAEKFGIEAHHSRNGKIKGKIVVTNYEQLEKFNPSDFAGTVCDESSILKSFDGVRRHEITEFMRKIRYRLLCTATAAPNDYIELGTSSEALGYLGHMDMLNRFFKNEQNTSDTKGHWRGFHAPRKFEGRMWRFKGHAEQPFWKWVCSWARAVRKPSDIGFEDRDFKLPELIEKEHVIKAKSLPNGMLFSMPAIGMAEQREERRRTVKERCEKAASLLCFSGKSSLVWCHLNDEGDLLEQMIDGAVQVSGKDSDEEKEEKFMAFTSGQIHNLITKPKIGAWGLNFQHCSHEVTFPSHSFEQYYQAVRRCWRFGQKNPVTVDIIASEGERGVLDNLQRKQVAADRMFSSLVEHMQDALHIERSTTFTEKEAIPSWL